MDFIAPVRVRGPAGATPSPAGISAAAVRLTELGFIIDYIGIAGISPRSAGDTFTAALGVSPPGPVGYSLATQAQDPLLKSALDRVDAYPPLEML